MVLPIYRFGIAITQINQIIPNSVAGLDSRGQQLLAIRQITYGSITDVVVSQLPGLARAGGDHEQSAFLGRSGDYPFVIRRNSFARAVTNANRRRPVGIAYEHSVGGAAAIAIFGGALQMYLGQPDTAPRLDNVHRFMAGVYLSTGVINLWAAFTIREQGTLVYLLALGVFLAGVGRAQHRDIDRPEVRT